MKWDEVEPDEEDQIDKLAEDGIVTDFQASILRRAIRDEVAIVQSMAIAYLAEPNKLIMNRLIDRYMVRLGHRYAQVEFNLNEILSSGLDSLFGSDKDLLIRTLHKIRLRGEQLMISKLTLDKINTYSEELGLPLIK